MSHLALRITRTQITRWLMIQLAIIVLATSVVLLLKGRFLAQSIFLGGMLSFLPQWAFARFWLRSYKASHAPRLVKMFYVGEGIKLCLIAVLFILALKYIAMNVIACFIGFMIAQIAFWIAPFF